LLLIVPREGENLRAFEAERLKGETQKKAMRSIFPIAF